MTFSGLNQPPIFLQCMRLMFESEHYTSISALASIGGGGGGGGNVLEMGLLYPGPGYEAIICFTHCKQSKLEVGLGTRLQE